MPEFLINRNQSDHTENRQSLTAYWQQKRTASNLSNTFYGSACHDVIPMKYWLTCTKEETHANKNN